MTEDLYEKALEAKFALLDTARLLSAYYTILEHEELADGGALMDEVEIELFHKALDYVNAEIAATEAEPARPPAPPSDP